MTIGHNTNVYSSRYPDPFSQVTTFAEAGNKPMGSYVTLDFDMSTNADYQLVSPVDGIVRLITVAANVNTNANDTAVLGAIMNDSASVTIANAVTYDADPALVAFAETNVTRNSGTAANIAVSRGDVISCNYGDTNNVTHTSMTVFIEQIE